MGFDVLAPHYRWMELVLAGGKLQRCRTAFLEGIKTPLRVLIAGEGNGRFLCRLRLKFPTVPVTVIEASARMLAEAKNRIAGQESSMGRIEFIQADILEWDSAAGEFDLIVTHFFLDCFAPEDLRKVVRKLAVAATASSRWLLSDFRVPQTGLMRQRARLIHGLMYVFFRNVTGLKARKLTPPDDFLQQQGFVLEERKTSEWGLLHSDCWRRGSGKGVEPPRRGGSV